MISAIIMIALAVENWRYARRFTVPAAAGVDETNGIGPKRSW
jgi:hypothetical protein